MKILFATGNKNKIAEAGTLFGELGYDVEGLVINGNRPIFIEPQCNSLMEVALSKIIQARSMIKNSDLEGSPILVEDSGIFIDSIENFPGVFSSFIFETMGLSGILKLLETSQDRGAEYRCVTILDWNGKMYHSNGICKGKLGKKEVGTNGFGYDPIFIPHEGNGRTFSEMTKIEKSSISHRSKSLRGLLTSLQHPSK